MSRRNHSHLDRWRAERRSNTCRRWLHAGWFSLSILCFIDVAPARLQAQAAAGSDSGASGVAQARVHFERGVGYYDEGDYREALSEFQRAYGIQHAYQLLYNLGQVAEELRDYAGAERYFRRYLVDGEGGIAADRRAEVVEELARLNERIGSLRIHTNVAGAEIHVENRVIKDPDAGPVRVSAGQRKVVAEKPGYAPVSRVVEVPAGEELPVSLVFGPPLADAQRTGPERKSVSNPLPWITGVGSAALLIGAVGVGYLAYTDAQAYRAELDRFTTKSDLDRLSSNAQSKALVADLLLATALAGAAVTIVMLATRGASEKPAAAASHAGVTLDAEGVRLRF